MRRPRTVFRITILFLLVALSVLDHAGAFGARRPDRERYSDIETIVTRVVDGDTIEIAIEDGEHETTQVRFLGLDCPKLVNAVGGESASMGQNAEEFLRAQVVSKRVRLVLEPHRACRDRDGRLQGYVYMADTGEMLNEMLLDRGFAYADTRSIHVMKRLFGERETRAALRGLGLWKGITPDQLSERRRRLHSQTEYAR
ncbi:MAG: thermonuclease family protein [Planctomycetes bacterium]|nr:thermonuclease family protein [Planctomycetota bacterium]